MPIVTSQRGTTAVIGRGYRTPYKYRQIITTGYVAGGYANSVPWRNVNYVVAATDTTTSLGDLLQTTHNYTSGAHNRDHAFMWGGSAVPGVSGYTSCFNMRTNTTLAKTTAMNSPVDIGDCATVQRDLDYAWVFNCAANPTGSAAVDTPHRFNLVTEQSSSTFTIIGALTQGGGAHYTDTDGYIWGAQKIKFNFATETQTAGGDYANHGQQKGLPSKNGFGYAGNEGSYNGGNSLRKWNQVTDVLQSTIAKPVTNCGEENFTQGQDYQYMLGSYDGAQNNRAWRFTYATDSGFEGGATMQPKGGQSGRSSGHCFWRD